MSYIFLILRKRNSERGRERHNIYFLSKQVIQVLKFSSLSKNATNFAPPYRSNLDVCDQLQAGHCRRTGKHWGWRQYMRPVSEPSQRRWMASHFFASLKQIICHMKRTQKRFDSDLKLQDKEHMNKMVDWIGTAILGTRYGYRHYAFFFLLV